MPASDPSLQFTAFAGHRRLAAGDLGAVAAAVHAALAADRNILPLVFSDATGKQVDLDVHGTEADVRARYAQEPASRQADAPPRGRGRPRLGVVAREVTLLPDQWDWLASQPGGISVALRKLVHQARRCADAGGRRTVHERVYAFMSAIGGDLPAFEEASRALFADDTARLMQLTAQWPPDVRAHLARLSG